MKRDQFHFCSFQEDIIKTALAKESHDGTMFVFPTESSKNLALRRLQKDWQLTTTQIVTMEEFKELAFLSERAVLKEEKRTLALFDSLAEDHRRHFKIHHYFQSIELARNFFELWEEFNDELVDPADVQPEKFIRENSELLDWQFDTFLRLKKMRDNYQKYIHDKGFEDVIFLRNNQHFSPISFADFERIVVVNQFYYTRLERFILEQLQSVGKIIRIYYQIPETYLDTETLTVKSITLHDIREYDTEKVQIIECPNDFTMMVELFRLAQNCPLRTVVDVAFWKKPYSRFISPEHFQLRQSISMTETSVFRFFKTLSQIMDSLIWDGEQQEILLPIGSILNAALNEDFCSFLEYSPDDRAPDLARDQILRSIYDLIERDYLYIDFKANFFTIAGDKVAQQFAEKLIALLQRALQLRDIESLIDWIDSAENGIDIQRIQTPAEKEYSDLLQVFYQALADLGSIERVKIVESEHWRNFFVNDLNKNNSMNCAAGILKLFVDYLKAKNVRFETATQAGLINISDLEDTRNIRYSTVAALNVSEGIIPGSRKTPFLFTEGQRKALGLKTYREIREREKYYFYRLILNSRQVYLLVQKNIEQNIDASSFVEELKIYFPRDRLKLRQLPDQYYGSIYAHIIKPLHVAPDRRVINDPDFYRIPLDIEKDFAEANLDLSFYSLNKLKQNPYVFYLRWLRGIEPLPQLKDGDFSAKLLGYLVHDMINEIWRMLVEEHGSTLFGYDFSRVQDEYIDAALVKVIRNQQNYYKFPRNYSRVYFEQILLPGVRDSILNFFQEIEKLFQGAAIDVIPEKDYGFNEERQYKQLIPATANQLGKEIRIRGRADLRINPQGTKEHYIFDYKTGGGDRDQLIFYELYYYLIDNPDLADQIFSFFYHIIDQRLVRLKQLMRRTNKNERIHNFKLELVEVLNRIALNGFELPLQKSKLHEMQEIFRSDLFLNMISRRSEDFEPQPLSQHDSAEKQDRR
ncbi:MAG TPA: hypothetical protein ENN22_11930 [bacterium]|nr:hypothetical protein [bacterium]